MTMAWLKLIMLAQINRYFGVIVPAKLLRYIIGELHAPFSIWFVDLLLQINIMRKSYLLTVFIVVMIALLFAFTAPDKSRRLYKNLKVLPKDITKPEMDTLMRGIARSLGVKCDYCHVRNVGKEGLDFASDEEETKLTARDMMRMQAKINKKYFNVKEAGRPGTKLQVTCYTCHHAQAIPAKKAATPGSQPPQPKPKEG